MTPNWSLAEKSLEEEKCRRSAHYFIFDSDKLLTKDEHDSKNPVKAFPHTLYLRSLLDTLLVSGRLSTPETAIWAKEAGHSHDFLSCLWNSGILAVEKSRQMMVTWLVCAYLLWRSKYLPHQLILVQSKREDDAANLVFNKEPFVARISFMESHLPSHLRSIQFPHGGAYGHLYYPNGSHNWAIPEGADIIRSNSPSVWFCDESAFQPEFGGAYTAAVPAVKGGGQAVMVSSAEPGEYQNLIEAAA